MAGQPRDAMHNQIHDYMNANPTVAGVFLAEASGAGSRPVIFLAAETTAFTIFPPISVMKAP